MTVGEDHRWCISVMGHLMLVPLRGFQKNHVSSRSGESNNRDGGPLRRAFQIGKEPKYNGHVLYRERV